MYGMTRPLQQSEKDYLQASVEQIYDKFTTIVAEGRGMRVSAVDSVGQGRVWTGAEALEAGLVDEIGTLEDAINFAAMHIAQTYNQTSIEVFECPRPLSSIELLMDAFGLNLEATLPCLQPFHHLENAFRDWTATQSGKVYARIPYVFSIQ